MSNLKIWKREVTKLEIILTELIFISTEVCLIMASSHEELNLNPFFFKSTFASSICWKEDKKKNDKKKANWYIQWNLSKPNSI